MDTDDQPEPDEDRVVNLVMAVGVPAFAVGLALLCIAGFYVARLIASFLFPGANP